MRETPPMPSIANEAELETEIDRFPGSIQAYEELARKLVGRRTLAGRARLERAGDDPMSGTRRSASRAVTQHGGARTLEALGA